MATICLTAIVKNEETCIGRMLDNLLEQDFLDGLLVSRRGNVGRVVGERELHGDVDEDAALIVVRFDDPLDHVE